MAAGGEDGSLHLIQLDRPHARHEVVREAHKVSSGLLGCFSSTQLTPVVVGLGV